MTRYIEIDATAPGVVELCTDCGSVVYSPIKHDEWHDRIDTHAERILSHEHMTHGRVG